LFGQQALEGTIQKSVADAVVSDLYNRANMTVDGNKLLNEEITVMVSNIEADAQVLSKSGIIEVNRSSLYKGYDTILLLAHEIGHYKKKHTIQFMVASIFQMGVMLWLFSLFVHESALSQALGGETARFQLGLIAFTLLYTPISLVLGLFMNNWSRKNEYEADAFATQKGQGEFLISGLKKISVKALSNLTPHPIYEWVYYSHPS
jgi:hypothetical protein